MKMEQFFINKTGIEMLDVFRAYGLGFLLRGIEREDLEVTIRDENYAFILELFGEVPSSPDEQIFAEVENSWREVFRTYRERKDSKKRHPKEEVKEILTDNFIKILDEHRHFDHLPQIGSVAREGRTLYQSIDLSAAKGFREPKLGLTYHDGKQIMIDKCSWALACFGAACVGSWQRGKDFIICLVPNPTEVSLESHRQLQRDLRGENICNLSAVTALTHYSVILTEKIARMKSSRGIVPNLLYYDSVIFNVMRKTGQQPKPGGGGKYGLNFLNKLLNEPYGVEVFDRMNKIFRAGWVKGIKQDLAFALGDFLMHPTLENFRRYEGLNIRGYINENVPLWNKNELEAILRHVEVV